jgi:hypothetical protein
VEVEINAGRRRGGIMPDFSKCVNDENGKIYCLDRETGEVVELTMEIVSPHQIPEKTLMALFRAVAGDNREP